MTLSSETKTHWWLEHCRSLVTPSPETKTHWLVNHQAPAMFFSSGSGSGGAQGRKGRFWKVSGPFFLTFQNLPLWPNKSIKALCQPPTL